MFSQNVAPLRPYPALPHGAVAAGFSSAVIDRDMLPCGTAFVARKKKTTSSPTSQFLGISWRRDRGCRAHVYFHARSFHIGTFDHEADAVLHYDVVAASLGKPVNDNARAKLIVDRYPREIGAIANAMRADDGATVRQMAKHVAKLFVRGTPGEPHAQAQKPPVALPPSSSGYAATTPAQAPQPLSDGFGLDVYSQLGVDDGRAPPNGPRYVGLQPLPSTSLPGSPIAILPEPMASQPQHAPVQLQARPQYALHPQLHLALSALYHAHHAPPTHHHHQQQQLAPGLHPTTQQQHPQFLNELTADSYQPVLSIGLHPTWLMRKTTCSARTWFR
jgi:hypothetical protein